MATPKFDLISTNLATAIGDPVANASTSGTVLSANERTAYVNRAVEKFYTDFMSSKEASVLEVIIGIFPELYQKRDIACAYADGDSKYTLATPNLDIHKVVSAIGLSNVNYIQVMSEALFTVVKSGIHPHYVFSETKPALIQMDNVIYLFPATIAETGDYNVSIYALVKPVVPTTGGQYTQGGTYDIVFNQVWIPKISFIAEQLYRVDSQETI